MGGINASLNANTALKTGLYTIPHYYRGWPQRVTIKIIEKSYIPNLAVSAINSFFAFNVQR